MARRPTPEEKRKTIETVRREQVGRGAETTTGGEMSQSQLLKRIRDLIEEIEVSERTPRGVTAPGRKAPPQYRTRMVSVRLPVALVRDLEALPGSKTSHIERSLRLYFQALKSS